MDQQVASVTRILKNGKIITLNERNEITEAIAIQGGKVLSTGSLPEVRRKAGATVEELDLGGRTVIPGLNDSHIHLIRGGLSFNQELRWEGLSSLADGLRMVKEQAQRTPPPQWVRIVGGWTEHQFRERRLPTLDELNEAAPETPVFVLHLYDRALLNRAALHAVGYTKESPDPPGGYLERDRNGNPTGLLVANPNAWILYSTLAKGPKLNFDDRINSTLHFMRELNRLAVTSIIDAGGGFHYYPEDYQVIEKLHSDGLLTLRIAYNLFTQKPGAELEQFQGWTKSLKYLQGDSFYRCNGAGEMLVFSASDFEDFRVARPELAPGMGGQLEGVVRHLASEKWPFRLHATYNESISRALDVFERVHRDIPLDRIQWFFDHAETISDRNIDRVAALGGGIAIQHRMAFQGEYFISRYGETAAARTPPIRQMMAAGLPVGAGTDATRVASYNPFTALYWLITGRTVGGRDLYPEENRLTRIDALRRFTVGSSWFSNEQSRKGGLVAGQYADLAVLSRDFLEILEDEITCLESVLTMVGGKVVYASGPFQAMAPPAPAVSPSWSPVGRYTPYGTKTSTDSHVVRRHSCHRPGSVFGPGCDCFAF